MALRTVLPGNITPVFCRKRWLLPRNCLRSLARSRQRVDSGKLPDECSAIGRSTAIVLLIPAWARRAIAHGSSLTNSALICCTPPRNAASNHQSIAAGQHWFVLRIKSCGCECSYVQLSSDCGASVGTKSRSLRPKHGKVAAILLLLNQWTLDTVWLPRCAC